MSSFGGFSGNPPVSDCRRPGMAAFVIRVLVATGTRKRLRRVLYPPLVLLVAHVGSESSTS